MKLNIDFNSPTIFPILLIAHMEYMTHERLMHGTDCTENPENCVCNIRWAERMLQPHFQRLYAEQYAMRVGSMIPIKDFEKYGFTEQEYDAYMHKIFDIKKPFTLHELTCTVCVLN